MLVVGEPLLYLVAFKEGCVVEVVAVLQLEGCVCLSLIRQRKEGSVIDRYICHSPGNSR